MMKYSLILLVSLALVSCSKNYTGEYEHKYKTKKTYYADTKTGEEVRYINPLASFGVNKPSSPQYIEKTKEIDTKITLSIKQEDTKVTGNLIISNEATVIKFNIEYGEVDENGLLRLKLIKSIPVADIGVVAGPISFTKKFREKLQLNLNQAGEMKSNKISFNFSTASNIPLFVSSGINKTVTFTKR